MKDLFGLWLVHGLVVLTTSLAAYHVKSNLLKGNLLVIFILGRWKWQIDPILFTLLAVFVMMFIMFKHTTS